MNTPNPLPARSGTHAAEPTSADEAPHMTAVSTEPANDSEFYSNPLWEVTMALACLALLLLFLIGS